MHGKCRSQYYLGAAAEGGVCRRRWSLACLSLSLALVTFTGSGHLPAPSTIFNKALKLTCSPLPHSDSLTAAMCSSLDRGLPISPLRCICASADFCHAIVSSLCLHLSTSVPICPHPSPSLCIRSLSWHTLIGLNSYRRGGSLHTSPSAYIRLSFLSLTHSTLHPYTYVRYSTP